MTIKKALLVYKKSAYQTYFMEYRHPNVIRLARLGDLGLAHIKRSHEVHYQSLKGVENTLKRHGIKFDHRYRGKAFNENRYDLIISIGGDGTFLDAARNIRFKPIVGVNSDTGHSVGRFCAADRRNFPGIFEKILKDQFKILPIQRMEMAVNGHSLNKLVLNDILICHSGPAAMSHYILVVNGRKEQQRSSGLWISTAAGSTGAMRSAGGRVLPLASDQFQYMPRELFDGHGIHYRFKGGGISRPEDFKVCSQMQEGMIYIDGAHHPIAFKYGDRLTISRSQTPLNTITF